MLFVSSNGAGVGHLMRLMSMARRASPTVRPLFVTMSQAVPVVHEMGFQAEYVPSQGYLGVPTGPWHRLLHARLVEIIERHRPAALVFDGTWPYKGLLELRQSHPEVALVWSRRAMWRSDMDAPQLGSAQHFDLIIEPGEYARAVDRGPTTQRRHEVVEVGPILYLDEEDLLPRDEARRELGIDLERTAALVQLGAGNINDITSVVGTVVRRLSAEPGVQACLAESAISAELAGELDVHRFSVYPLARYLNAFDLAVSASGYNTFHELVGSGVPTIFVPNLETRADDQAARARYAEEAGVGIALPDPTPGSFDAALEGLLDPAVRDEMSRRARETFPANGAADAIAAIETLVEGRRTTASGPSPGPGSDQGSLPEPEPEPQDQPDLADVPRYTPRRATHGLAWRSRAGLRALVGWLATAWGVFRHHLGKAYGALPEPVQRPLRPIAQRMRERRKRRLPPLVMVVLRDHEGVEPSAVVDRVEAHHAERRFRRLYVTFTDDFSPYRRHDAPFEYIWGPDRWAEVGDADRWDGYVADRIETLSGTYEPRYLIDVTGDDDDTIVAALLRSVLTQVPPRQTSRT